MPRVDKPRKARAPRMGTTITRSSSVSKSASRPLYFWRPQDPYGWLGQWYDSPFTSNHSYRNCEQYMMHRKGLLFAPNCAITPLILDEVDPKIIKAMGREIPGFDEDVWKKERFEIVVEGNWLKFTQNPELGALLLETGERELVEASPRDRIWGVGYGEKKAPHVRHRWGLNLLGKALMEVRERLRKEKEEDEKDTTEKEGSYTSVFGGEKNMNADSEAQITKENGKEDDDKKAADSTEA